MVFAPYNALELKEILEARASLAFKESACADGVIAKCAAYAAREHGDARRALDLLRVAGELAERESSEGIDMKHIDLAEEKIEKSRIIEVVEKQPKQSQAVLFAIIELVQDSDSKRVETGEVYERYSEVCKSVGLTALTQRRVSDLLSELDMLGVINAQVVSKGRYGRTKEIYLSVSKQIMERIKEMLGKSLV
jgi:cell division control protein 6